MPPRNTILQFSTPSNSPPTKFPNLKFARLEYGLVTLNANNILE